MLIWDNLNTHISAAIRQMIDARDWLTVIGLPVYAPDLNPTEAVVPPQTQRRQPRRDRRRPSPRDHPHRHKSIPYRTDSTGSSLTPA